MRETPGLGYLPDVRPLRWRAAAPIPLRAMAVLLLSRSSWLAFNPCCRRADFLTGAGMLLQTRVATHAQHRERDQVIARAGGYDVDRLPTVGSVHHLPQTFDFQGAISRAQKRLGISDGEVLNPRLAEVGSCMHLKNVVCEAKDYRLIRALIKDAENAGHKQAGDALGMHRSRKHMQVFGDAMAGSTAFAALITRVLDMFDLSLVDCWLNVYRDDRDSKAWHHDNYQDRMPRPTVTIGVSLGQERDIAFKNALTQEEFRVPQGNGDIFAFDEPFNNIFKHSIPPCRPGAAPGTRVSVIIWANEQASNPRCVRRWIRDDIPVVVDWESWPTLGQGELGRGARRAANAQVDISIGQRVRVVGLKALAQLNGLEGTVAGWDAVKKRWKLRMADGTGKMLKSDNLEVIKEGEDPSVAEEQRVKAVSLEVSKEDAELSVAEEPSVDIGVGQRIRIIGLKARADMNGLEGTVIGWDDGQSRWKVRMVDGSGKMMKAANLEVIKKDIEPSVSEESTVKEDEQPSAAKEPTVDIGVGQRIRVVGLKGMAEMNGLEGNVAGWDDAKGRWRVRMADGRGKMFKPANLEVIKDDAKRAAAEESFVRSVRSVLS